MLEVMVAISIMAIVMVAIYRLHAQTISMSAASRFYAMAPILAKGKIAEFTLDSDNNKASDSGDFGDDFPGYAWRLEVEDLNDEDIGKAFENLKRIEVIISFSDDEFQYRFRTYKLMAPES